MPLKTPLNNASLTPGAPCPCGTGRAAAACCLPFIQGETVATTAEQVMRSRYTAHVVLAIDYLWNTWAAEQRQDSSPAAIRGWAEACEWLGLEIIATDKGGPNDALGLVSFIARFRSDGRAQEHRELSVFRRERGQWLYVNHA